MNKLQSTKAAILSILLIGGIVVTLTSCSGDDGSDGTTPMCSNGTWHNGEEDTGVSCSAESSAPLACKGGTWHNGGTDTGVPCTSSSVTPTCVDGTWHNGATDTGVPCTASAEGCVTTDKGAYIEIACGASKVEIAKAMCGATAYDPSKQVCDSRDGKMYKLVTIGTQVWMAENLNYNAETSKCYEEDPENCAKYGRLYNFETAITVCPTGLHLADTTEWNVLIAFAGGAETAGTKLKAKTGWTGYMDGTTAKSGDGTDDYGFTALPGGSNNGGFDGVGTFITFWTSTEIGANAYMESINNTSEALTLGERPKTSLRSIRCIKD